MDQVNACGNVLETQLEVSGASAKIGAVVGGGNSNFQALITAMELAGIGNIPPADTVTDAKLATECKLGVLADLTTTEKSNFVASLNEISTDIGTLDTNITALSNAYYALPIIGKIDFFASVSTPFGYLYADGEEVSRSIYSGLFSLIGTTYGVGNGSTTFNLPDLTSETTLRPYICWYID
jgi:hypothetical protein